MKCVLCGEEMVSRLRKGSDCIGNMICEKCNFELKSGNMIYHISNEEIKMMYDRTSYGRVECKWIDKIGNYHENKFPIRELEICKEQ